MRWDETGQTWTETSSGESGRNLPGHSRNGKVLYNKDTGVITSEAKGDADNGPIQGLKTTIDIDAQGADVTGKAKFEAPGLKSGEIVLTVTYQAQ